MEASAGKAHAPTGLGTSNKAYCKRAKEQVLKAGLTTSTGRLM